MSTAEIAKDFTELLKHGDSEGAATKYNADDIVSYEAMEGPMAVCHGKEAVKQKGQWWQDNHEVHGGLIEGPYVFDVTTKASGERSTMDEVGLYTVKNGKISEERFYY